MGSNQDGNNSLAGLGRIVYDNGDKYVGGFVNNKKEPPNPPSHKED